MSPNQTPGLVKKIYPSLVWKKESKDEIFLTFDDGPHPEITPWVLEELDRVGAKATFFCVGKNLQQHKSIGLQAVRHGHRLANHTYHHENGWKTTIENYLESARACNEIVSEIQGETNNLFRPPYGRVKRNQIAKLRADYRIIMWSHLSGDFKEKLNISKSIVLLKRIKPGSIVVFHDNEKSFTNLKAILPACLDHWSSLNYKFGLI